MSRSEMSMAIALPRQVQPVSVEPLALGLVAKCQHLREVLVCHQSEVCLRQCHRGRWLVAMLGYIS